MQELNTLAEILESFLGESKESVSDNGQIQYNCPACADDNGLEDGDGKYNLEINLLSGKYRCWACEHTNNMSGKLSNLIKKYGSESLLYKFRDEVKNIKKSKEYEFNFIENNLVFEEDEELIVKLPDNTYDFKFDGNKREAESLKYLTDRGITESLIKKYGLKYTDYYCPNRNFRSRIIIPSYDKYGTLNYYTGRDYTGNNFMKYFNYENSNRKEIIFNEQFINWDADVYLVEGPTDHIVVPNSIPLLGKYINSDYYLFECLVKKSTQNVVVFVDNDAYEDGLEICRKLSSIELCGRLRIIPTEKIRLKYVKENGYNDKKLDPNMIHQLYGKEGIAMALSQSEEYECS
jgi:hypothetical protein